MNPFKRGDRVQMLDQGRYVTGEVTILTLTTSKVLWDSGYDLDYWYYPNNELILIECAKNEHNIVSITSELGKFSKCMRCGRTEDAKV